MASEQPKQPKAEIADESDRGLDRAIDDLRGVLKKDAEGLSEIENMKPGDDKMGAGTDRAKALETNPRADFVADDEAAAFHPSPLGAAGDALFSGAPTFDDEDGGAAALFGPDSGAAALLGARIPDAQAASPRRRRDDEPANLDLIMDIPIDMEIVLGKSRLPVSGLMALGEGSLIALDRKIGEPVEIMVNGRLFGHGEITVLEGDETRFGVKLIEILGGMKN